MSEKEVPLTFVVVGHATDKKIKKGVVEAKYKVTLETRDGRYRLQRKDKDPALLQFYALGAEFQMSVKLERQGELEVEAEAT